MKYESEFWAVDKNIERKMSVAEMKILKWMSRVTRIQQIVEGKIRN